MTGPVLRVEDLSVRFEAVHAVEGLSFTANAGEVVAIIGANGAGKTTTLNAISRVIPSTGEVTVAGRPTSGLRPSQIAALGVGRSFQDPQLIDRYSLLENVLCGSHLQLRYGLFDQLFRRGRVHRLERVARDRALSLLEFAGLGAVAAEPAGAMPYGVRKIVDIVRAVQGNPAIVLLDEPSSGLDSTEREGLKRMLVALRDEHGLGVVIVEHHMDVVRATATTVLALQGGTLLVRGTPEEVLASKAYRSALVGQAADVEVHELNGVSQ